jgi:peptidoglycan biosynthesis protein MviN/MurJ (putative lipid II flippase)
MGSYYFKDTFGIMALALGFTAGSIAQLIFLWIGLRHMLTTLHESSLLHFLAKISIAILFMALTVQGLKTPLALLVHMDTFFGIFIQGTIAGTAGIGMYWLICVLFRIKEIGMFEDSVRRRWLSFKGMLGRIEGWTS